MPAAQGACVNVSRQHLLYGIEYAFTICPVGHVKPLGGSHLWNVLDGFFVAGRGYPIVRLASFEVMPIPLALVGWYR